MKIWAEFAGADSILARFNVGEAQVLFIKERRIKQGRTPIDITEIPVELGLQSEESYQTSRHRDPAAKSGGDCR